VIDIQRTASAGQYGVVHIYDQFTILNNGTTAVSSLDFAFARRYRENVYFAEAKDSNGNQLALDADVNKTSDFYWMRAHFAESLGFNKTYVFTVTMGLFGVITTTEAGYQYNFTAAPVLTQDARLANVTFITVAASTFRIPANTTYISTFVGGLPALINEYRPWRAYSNETFYGPYSTVNQFIVDLKSVERDIIIGSNGVLSVRDSYSLVSPSSTLSSLLINLPEGASNVMAYDQVGALWALPQNPSPPYQVTVQPRYSLGVRPKESFQFILTYDVPESKYIKPLSWWGEYNLTFTFLNNKDDLQFANATVRIVAPDGLTITDINIPEQSPLSYPIDVDQSRGIFKLRGITSHNDVTFGLRFTYLPFWSAFFFLPWITGFELAIIAVALVMRLRRRPEMAVPVPVEKLREFVGLYDERLALSRELVLMEEEVSRGGLVKHEFRRRSKAMELRLDEINRSLMEVKAELRAISARYDDMIRRIDHAEAEITASRASMNQIRSQYRAGKTTRETYDTMMNEISKRIDRAEGTVETILITLREEAR